MYKLITAVLFFFSLNVFANEVNSHSNLTNYLEKIRTQNDIPAMAVAVITSGEVGYIKGFGYVDEQLTEPTTDESLFRIASISKLFTAQAIMKLVEQEKLSLNDEVGQYLQAFKRFHITIKQLLTHSSGLSDMIKPVSFDEGRSVKSYLDLVSETIPRENESNSFEYSDTNFNILGAVISSVTGKSYEEFIYGNILKPAKVRKSNFYDGKNAYLSETNPTYKGKLIDQIDQRPYDLAFNPSEGLVSNVYDLSQWLKLTLGNDPSILKKQTYEAMLDPQVKTTWGEVYMALGWQVYRNEDGNVARHPGSIRGYKSLVLAYPENKNAIILLTNSSDTPRWEIAESITEILKQNSEW
ncbi:serine hydrolase domain-containing protein [Pseudoalteromonas mariniglutinosa]|uniref:serine hydrolase domain-containing protein n=1 Tax=Pseudoalteromonas mariniglutinosa TaxID=206042 RepID=UPI00384C5493